MFMLVLRPVTIGFFLGILKLNLSLSKTSSFLTIVSSILISFTSEGFFRGLSMFIDICGPFVHAVFSRRALFRGHLISQIKRSSDRVLAQAGWEHN